MGLSYHIAKRIAFNKQQSFSRFIIRLSVVATAVSITAMIITLAFVNGFQEKVADKIFGFWGHIRVQKYETGKSLISEELPLTKNTTVENSIATAPGVVSYQSFATKSAVLESQNDIEGVLIKGIEKNENHSALKQFLVAGRWIQFTDSLYSKETLVSDAVAKALQIKINDTIKVHFVATNSDAQKTYRKLVVVGFYHTGIDEYDKLFMIADINLIRRINNWEPNQIGGYEVFINQYQNINAVSSTLSNALPSEWMSKSIKEVYPNIFDWLDIQDVNRNVVFIVMGIVALINLITCLLILMLERTNMIGLLKSMGATGWTIQKIFIVYASFITLAGVGFGLVIGLGICFLQQATGFITLDEASYYISVAPVKIIGWQVAAVCAGTSLVCFVSLFLPTLLIPKISPVKAIEFK
ncbi:MAG: ABC transporter permease [Bacteroidetes bacterium]|nr:ABC transporter permease [Bacteroidota bacterium]